MTLSKLAERREEASKLIAAGMSRREAARRLGVTESTIRRDLAAQDNALAQSSELRAGVTFQCAAHDGDVTRAGPRRELVDAIARRDELTSLLAQAHEAKALAMDHLLDARSKRDAIEAEAKEPPEDDGAAIEAARTGNVAMLLAPKHKRQEELDKLDEEIGAWRRAGASAEAEVDRRKQALVFARSDVQDAVAAVVRAEANIDALVAEVQRKRIELRRLDEYVLTLVAGKLSPEQATVMSPHNWLFDPVPERHEWERGLKALETDADAPLPAIDAAQAIAGVSMLEKSLEIGKSDA
jgi:predicted transcriptional regulator